VQLNDEEEHLPGVRRRHVQGSRRLGRCGQQGEDPLVPVLLGTPPRLCSKHNTRYELRIFPLALLHLEGEGTKGKLEGNAQCLWPRSDKQYSFRIAGASLLGFPCFPEGVNSFVWVSRAVPRLVSSPVVLVNPQRVTELPGKKMFPRFHASCQEAVFAI